MRHVFIDESSQNAHRYMVLGAVVVPGTEVDAATNALAELLARHGVHAGELKWTKVSRGKLAAYQAAIDYYFDILVPLGAQCHALVVDTSLLDHQGYNQGDAEIGFNKFLFQLLFHRVGKPFGQTERIVVDMDARNSSRDLMELQSILNRRMVRTFGIDGSFPFARIAHRDSKKSRLIQISDIISGAVAWHCNDHDAVPGASEAKAQLANHIASKVGLRRLGRTSPMRELRLSIWNIQMGARKGRPAA